MMTHQLKMFGDVQQKTPNLANQHGQFKASFLVPRHPALNCRLFATLYALGLTWYQYMVPFLNAAQASENPRTNLQTAN